ncbi:hypothetical protein RPMA_19115 [Tardiphaga alba]|uniref:Uncharacterized protein n=1 Tax=Tardiphaga alba TaxID=340268 RepID=A0ABX8ACK6_9BRAD|nr:hypothetical protein [Tardiphaga alba]QUS40706.1 hypothetical protein RPMA_19115 [Tardiphaga alba]
MSDKRTPKKLLKRATRVKLKEKLRSSRRAMLALGWGDLDEDRDEPNFGSVCFVAVDALLRVEIERLSAKAVSQITTFVDYLMKAIVGRFEGPAPLSDPKDPKAYLCSASLFTCAAVLSTGGVWNGIYDEMSDGRYPMDGLLIDWNEDSLYFWWVIGDVTLDDIKTALEIT